MEVHYSDRLLAYFPDYCFLRTPAGFIRDKHICSFEKFCTQSKTALSDMYVG